jgi:hypothetical protein
LASQGCHDGGITKQMAMDNFEVLRNATEEETEAALAGSYVQDICGNVEPAALLEFWNRMLDRFMGSGTISVSRDGLSHHSMWLRTASFHLLIIGQ